MKWMPATLAVVAVAGPAVTLRRLRRRGIGPGLGFGLAAGALNAGAAAAALIRITGRATTITGRAMATIRRVTPIMADWPIRAGTITGSIVTGKLRRKSRSDAPAFCLTGLQFQKTGRLKPSQALESVVV